MLPTKGTNLGAKLCSAHKNSKPVLPRLDRAFKPASRTNVNRSAPRPAGPAIQHSRRPCVATQAVAAAPEMLLEKGGPGATYGNGAVAKVSNRRSHPIIHSMLGHA